MSTAMTIIYIMFILLLLIAVGFWLWLENKFKFRVRLKELVKGRKIIHNFRARYHTDTEGVSWWHLAGEKDKRKKYIPLPPEATIELDKKGRKCVDCYRFESGEVVFSEDDWNVGAFPISTFNEIEIPDDVQNAIDIEKDVSRKKLILTKWEKEVQELWYKEHRIVRPFQPMTTKQRLLYVQNIKKAEARKGFSWKENIIPMVSIGAMVILIICGMVFWGDMAAPVLSANDQANTGHQIQLETVQILKEIRINQQRILGETTPTPPD